MLGQFSPQTVGLSLSMLSAPWLELVVVVVVVTKSMYIRDAVKKQGPIRHRPMAHPVMFRYLSYSTTLPEHAVHRLRRCPAFSRAGTCLFLSVQLDDQSVTPLMGGHKTMA